MLIYYDTDNKMHIFREMRGEVSFVVVVSVLAGRMNKNK